MNKPQVIRDDTGKPAFAVIPWNEYEGLVGEAADAALSDEELHDLAIATDEESFPVEVSDRLLAGQNPIPCSAGTAACGSDSSRTRPASTRSTFPRSREEKRTGSARTLAAIARALRVDMDDLIQSVT